MDGSLSIRRSRRRGVCAAVGLVLAMLPVMAPGVVASPNRCWAKNVTQGTPPRFHLQGVIDAARAGDRIKVKQVCVGHFNIGKRLTLVGEGTPRVPVPGLMMIKPIALEEFLGDQLYVTVRRGGDLPIRVQ